MIVVLVVCAVLLFCIAFCALLSDDMGPHADAQTRDGARGARPWG